MLYNWYKIFNMEVFNALDLPSRTYTYELENIGLKDILVTKGNYVSIIYDGITLPVNLNDENPFKFESHAVYLNTLGDVYLGILIPDET